MKSKTLWLCRGDTYNWHQSYSLCEKEPKWDENDQEFNPEEPYEEFCSRQFESMTGIKLEPGELQKIEIRVVGDIWTFTD